MASQWEKIKWVPGTRLMVDGFGFVNRKCQHYFLTHMHSDHTTGLTKSFSAGTIYTSPISARLLDVEGGLRPPTVQVLRLGQPTVVDGVTVTAIDANHCPGAVMLLFEVPKVSGGVTTILHTGDCRWQNHLRSASCLATKKVDILMLDTTYAMPRYTFPPQQEAIDMMVQVMQRTLQEEPASLFVVGSYHIGKERAYLGAAQALGLKVYASAAKRRLLHLLDMPEQQLQLLTDDPNSAAVHVGQLGVTPDKLQGYLKQPGTPWKRVVGFRPTGWSYKRSGGLQVWREGLVEVVGVPYSEHSSWNDLRDCVAAIRPKKIIPTVNAANPDDAARIVEKFADLMDHSSNRSRIDMHIVRTPRATASPNTTDLVKPGACLVKQHSAMSSQTVVPVSCTGSTPGLTAAGVQQAVLQAETVLDESGQALCSSQLLQPKPESVALCVLLTQGCPSAQDCKDSSSSGCDQQVASEVHQVFDLHAVDIAEQQKLLERAEQAQRMKRAREQLAAAKLAKRKKRTSL